MMTWKSEPERRISRRTPTRPPPVLWLASVAGRDEIVRDGGMEAMPTDVVVVSWGRHARRRPR